MHSNSKSIKTVMVWGNWGPYHHHRFAAFKEAGERRGWTVTGLELYASSGHYAWKVNKPADGIVRFDLGAFESVFRPFTMTATVLPWLFRQRPDVVFLPSYWHWSLYLNAWCRILGCRVVMMNESHGGTERATGWRRRIKRFVVGGFRAALVGGEPHRRHFASLGLPKERIVLGYDAVDNEFYRRESETVRLNAPRYRQDLKLPRRYILNLGRFVPKKNLATLIRAFAELVRKPAMRGFDLVLVGSGEEEEKLKETAGESGLAVRGPVEPNEPEGGSVRFYGFRQIEENPVFYALASVFVLPSHYEEWGLVVNEAMACGLPVVVSRTLGCAEDLVADGENGFRFDPKSPQALTECLERLLENPETARAMGAKSRERIARWGLDRFASGAIEAAEIAQDTAR